MDNSNDITLKAEIAEMKNEIIEALHRISKSEGAIEQLNKSIAAGNRMTNWQFIGFVVVMAGTLFGTLYWATGVLDKRLEHFEKNIDSRFEMIDKRFELMDKRIDQVEKTMNERFNATDKRFDDMNRRFEDLKQIVLSKR
jgi:flagellar capping protein FliD